MICRLARNAQPTCVLIFFSLCYFSLLLYSPLLLTKLFQLSHICIFPYGIYTHSPVCFVTCCCIFHSLHFSITSLIFYHPLPASLPFRCPIILSIVSFIIIISTKFYLLRCLSFAYPSFFLDFSHCDKEVRSI